MTDWAYEFWVLRMDARLSQHEAASCCSVSPNTISRWENGHTTPPEYVKDRCRDALAVEIAMWNQAHNARLAKTSEVKGERSEA